MEKVGDILSLKGQTVNSLDKSLSTVNSNTVNSTVWEEIENLIASRNIEPEGIANYLAERLEDSKSLKYFTLLVNENNPSRLIEAMHLTVEAWKDKRIRTKKPVYFIGILRRWGLKTNFREGKGEK